MWDDQVEMRMPDLDLGSVAVTSSLWLRPIGASVHQGERLLEVSAGEVIVDLPAPVDGLLAARHVEENELLTPGQLLAVIDAGLSAVRRQTP